MQTQYLSESAIDRLYRLFIFTIMILLLSKLVNVEDNQIWKVLSISIIAMMMINIYCPVVIAGQE